MCPSCVFAPPHKFLFHYSGHDSPEAEAEDQAPPNVWPEKRKRPKTTDPGVIGTTDEENFFFCLFVFSSLPLTLSPLLANPLTTWQRVSTKKCKSFSSSSFFVCCYFPWM